MDKKLLLSSELKTFFAERDYKCVNPHQIVNNSDTVFLTAGIQPILSDYINLNLTGEKIYLSQPVIRTQFANSISEGSSIAFINSTTAGFNILENDHNNLVDDWLELFAQLGMNLSNLSKNSKEYERLWGNLLVSGKKTFYYYNGLELGDTTFFTSITKDGEKIGIDSMSDIGFGLERIRWCVNGNSYFVLYSNNIKLSAPIKAYLSAIALLTVNGIKPSNRNSGYRVRLFSKKLVELLSGKELSSEEENYLLQCIDYWKDWQEVNEDVDIETIKKEYIRNCNRYIVDILTKEGYTNLSGININISREEMEKRLISSNVEKARIRRLIR